MDVPKKDVVGLHGGGSEQGQRVQAGAAGGEPRGLDAGRFSAAHEVQGCFGIGSAGVEANAFGGHGNYLASDGCEFSPIVSPAGGFVEDGGSSSPRGRYTKPRLRHISSMAFAVSSWATSTMSPA